MVMRRQDQRQTGMSRAGSGPAPQQFFFPGGIIVIANPPHGLFVYSSAPPTTGNLIESIVSANGTDGHGNTVYAGTATYSPSGGQSFVVTLLSTVNNAFFQYANPSGGVQGSLIAAVSSANGTDPVTGHSYLAGFYGIDPVFGDTIQVVGANIHLGQTVYTRTADLIAHASPGGAANPYILVDAPEQTTALHMQQLWQGASPDGTSAPQMLIGQVAGAAVLASISSAMVEVQGGTSQAVMQLQADAAATAALNVRVAGDTVNRYAVAASGSTFWGSGSAALDINLFRPAAGILRLSGASLDLSTAGQGLQVKEGANAKQGTATLAAGTVLVANTSVTASSRIFLTAQDNNSTGALRISARVAGTSFTITSSNAADTGVVAWEIFEPG